MNSTTDTTRIARQVEMDLRGSAITADEVQRALEHGARRGFTGYAEAASMSDRKFGQFVKAVAAARKSAESFR